MSVVTFLLDVLSIQIDSSIPRLEYEVEFHSTGFQLLSFAFKLSTGSRSQLALREDVQRKKTLFFV